MRKKIANLFLAFVLFFPCFFMFTACDDTETANVTSIEVVLAEESSYQMTNNTITVQYGSKVELDEDDFKVTAKLDDDTTKVISLKTEEVDGYTITSTLPTDNITPAGDYKITFAYGEEIKVEITVKVAKATVDMSGVQWDYTQPFIYDKSEKEVKVTGLPTGVTVAYDGTAKATNAGEYSVTAIFTYSDSTNYNAIPNMELAWEIEKATINVSSVTFANKTYLGTSQTITKSDITSQLPNGVEVKDITGTTSGTNAQAYNVTINFQTVDPDERNNYNIPSLNTSWSIAKRALTITANNHSTTYGISADLNEVTYSGFVTGEDVSDLSGSLVFTGYSAGDDADEYTITPSGLTSANYEISFVPGVLTVEKKALTIVAKDHTITYGSAASNNGVEYSGLLTGDESSLSGTLSYDYDGYAVGSGVNTYEITPSGLTSTNYNITFEAGTLTVVKKALTITAENKTVIYGENVPTGTVIYNGFIAGEDETALTGTISFDFDEYTAGSGVDTYTITASGLSSNNYEISFLPGVLTVNPKALTITAENKSVTYGDATPEGTVTYDGFVPGEDKEDLAGELSFNFEGYVAGGDVNTYDITPSGLTSTNYEISFVPGTLTVNKKGLTITANNHSIEYGATASNNDVTYDGFIDDEDESVLTGEIQFSYGDYVVGSDVGDYVITITGVSSPNYNITFNNGTLTITKKSLTVTIGDIELTYGDTLTSDASVSYNGFITGEDEEVLGGALVLDYDGYEAGSPAGEYVISADGLESDNYDIHCVNGTLTVSKKSLQVRANNASITYGEAATNAGVEITGFILDEDESVLDIATLTYTYGNYEVGSDASHYPIIPSGLESNNYSFGYVEGVLTVSKKALTITPNGVTAQYGTPVDEIVNNGIEFDGFIDGDDASCLDGKIEFTYGEYTSESGVGDYDITITGLTSNNYEITFETGTLTINPQEIDVSVVGWPTKSKYGVTGNAIEPKLNNLPDNVTDNYAYFASGDLVTPVQPITEGTYIAKVTLTASSANYVLINNEISEFTFEIGKESIDLSLVTWGDVNEFGVTGEAIKPTLQNLPEDGTVEANYTYYLRDGSATTESIEVGEYYVSVELSVAEEYAEMYVLENYAHISDFEYSIVLNRIDESKLYWSIPVVVDEYGNENAVVEWAGEPITIELVNETGAELDIQYNGASVANGTGEFHTYASVTLSEESQNKYEEFSKDFNLNWSVVINPFSEILINGVEVSYADFVLTPYYAIGTSFKFTPNYVDESDDYKYVLYNMNDEKILNDSQENVLEYTIDSYIESMNFIVKHEINNDYSQDINISPAYILDELTIGDRVYLKSGCYNYASDPIQLGQNDNSITIDFDEEYLNAFDSIELIVDNDYENPFEITSVPYVLEDLREKSSIALRILDNGQYVEFAYISIIQFTMVEYVTFGTLDLNAIHVDDTINTERYYQTVNGRYIDFSVTDEIITNYSVVYKEAFTGYTSKLFTDKTLSTEITDFKTVANLVDFVLAIYSNEEDPVEIINCHISYTFYDDSDPSKELRLGYDRMSTFHTSDKTFAVTFNDIADVYNFTGMYSIGGELNQNAQITFTDETTISLEYILKVPYTAVTYSISIPVIVYNYMAPNDILFSENNDGSSYSVSMGEELGNVTFNVQENTIDMHGMYNNLNINKLDVNAFEFDFVALYNEVPDTRTLEQIDGTYYVKLTLLPVTEEDTEENYITTYVELLLEDVIDNDTTAEVVVTEHTTETETPITDNSETIQITNPSTQSIRVNLKNRFATARIEDLDGNVYITSENGYLWYIFARSGDYKLIIIATDETTRLTYNIHVAEIIPLLEITVNGTTYTMTNIDDPNSDFQIENEGAKLYVNLEGDFSTTPASVTISEFRSSMFNNAELYYDADRTEVINHAEPFTLEVVSDGDIPYAVFYTSFGNAIYLYLGYYSPEQGGPSTPVVDINALPPVTDAEVTLTVGDIAYTTLNGDFKYDGYGNLIVKVNANLSDIALEGSNENGGYIYITVTDFSTDIATSFLDSWNNPLTVTNGETVAYCFNFQYGMCGEIRFGDVAEKYQGKYGRILIVFADSIPSQGGGSGDEGQDMTTTEVEIEYNGALGESGYVQITSDNESYTAVIENCNPNTIYTIYPYCDEMALMLLDDTFDIESENYLEAMLHSTIGYMQYVFQEEGTYYLAIASGDREHFRLITLIVTGDFRPMYEATLVDGENSIDINVSLKKLSDLSFSSETVRHSYDLTTGGEYGIYDNQVIDFLGSVALTKVVDNKLTLTSLVSPYDIYLDKEKTPLNGLTFDVLTDLGRSYIMFYLSGTTKVSAPQQEGGSILVDVDTWVIVKLYLMDAQNYVDTYPLTITVGNYSFDFKFNPTEIMNHGPEIIFDDYEGLTYVMLTPKQIGFEEGSTTVDIRFELKSEVKGAGSYAVLTLDGFRGIFMEEFASFEDAVAAGEGALPSLVVPEDEEGDVDPQTEEEPLPEEPTIPNTLYDVDFSEGYCVLYIACEGYSGVLEEANDYTFIPLGIIINAGGDGNEGVAGGETQDPGQSGESVGGEVVGQ